MADRIVRVTSDFARVKSHAEARCRHCGWTVIFPPGAIPALFPQSLPLDLAARKLRCRRCGRREARLRALYREYHG